MHHFWYFLAGVAAITLVTSFVEETWRLHRKRKHDA